MRRRSVTGLRRLPPALLFGLSLGAAWVVSAREANLAWDGQPWGAGCAINTLVGLMLAPLCTLGFSVGSPKPGSSAAWITVVVTGIASGLLLYLIRDLLQLTYLAQRGMGDPLTFALGGGGAFLVARLLEGAARSG